MPNTQPTIQDVLTALGSLGIKFDRVEKKVDNQGEILKEHTKILNHHTELLKEHGQTLKEHTRTLKEHSVSFEDLGEAIQSLATHMDERFDTLKAYYEEDFVATTQDILQLKKQGRMFHADIQLLKKKVFSGTV